MRNAMNELNEVVNIILDECAKFKDIDKELDEVLKILHIVDSKQADSLENDWKYLNIERKSELLADIYTHGIHFEGNGFNSHHYIKTNHIIEKLYDAFPYVSPINNTVDHYIADDTLPSNSISSLKYELMSTSTRRIQQKGWTIENSIDRLINNTGFNECSNRIKSMKTSSKKVSFNEPRFAIKFEHTHIKDKGKSLNECTMFIKSYFPVEEPVKRKYDCTVFDAVVSVTYTNTEGGYKSIAEKLAYLKFIEYIRSLNEMNTYFNDDTYLTCELRDLRRDTHNKIKRIG